MLVIDIIVMVVIGSYRYYWLFIDYLVIGSMVMVSWLFWPWWLLFIHRLPCYSKYGYGVYCLFIGYLLLKVLMILQLQLVIMVIVVIGYSLVTYGDYCCYSMVYNGYVIVIQ